MQNQFFIFFGVVALLLALGWYWGRKAVSGQEPFDGDTDDLQGTKKLGVKINGVRQIQIESGGLRFTPGGTIANQSLLQQFYYDQINIGGWQIGTTTLTANTLLNANVTVQRIGNLVTIQVDSLGRTTSTRTGSSISTVNPLPAHLTPRVPVYGFLLDEAKRSISTNSGSALCVAIINSSNKITIQRYLSPTSSSSFGGSSSPIQFSSFVLQYFVSA